MVLESGLLQERADRYELTGPLPPLAIPATLHDSLMARADLTPGPAPVGGGRVLVPAWAAAAGDVPLQACPDPGRGVSVAAQKHAAAVPPAHCRGVGGALSRDRRDPARAAGA